MKCFIPDFESSYHDNCLIQRGFPDDTVVRHLPAKAWDTRNVGSISQEMQVRPLGQEDPLE